jgi:hypothetical protein
MDEKDNPQFEAYIGAKVVKATPMDFNTFSQRQGKGMPAGNMEGYAVIYEDGYTSWSPKEVFERCYRKITPTEKILVG